MFDYRMADKIVERIAAVFSPQLIIVLGSAARHEAGDHSDLDILIVMNTDLKGTKRAVAVHKQTTDFMMPMDVFVLTPSEYEENKDNKYSFVREIVRTGTVVYDSFSDRIPKLLKERPRCCELCISITTDL